MTPVFHGGRLDEAIAEYGGIKADWLDLSTGINPNAYPVPEISSSTWQRLPDDQAEKRLISAARDYYKVPDHIGLTLGNGTQALIQALPHALGRKTVSIVSPTYDEHRNCWERSGCEVFAAASLDEAVQAGDIVVVVNPNNPTGHVHQPVELEQAANLLAQKSGVLIVDEAFADCCPQCSLVPYIPQNTIVLRSFGKFFGLAGLRLGFAICHEPYAELLRDTQGPWNVSGPALEIGAHAFSDQVWVDNTRLDINEHSKAQTEVLEACGLNMTGNAGLFMEFEHDGASRLYKALMREQILVRPFSDRPTRLRFGLCKNMQDLERLAWALKKHA